MKQDCYVKIKIEFSNGVKHKIELFKPLFGRRVGMIYNNKFAGFFAITKITNKIRKILQ